MARAIILAGGELSSYHKIKAMLPSAELIICADSGTRHASELSLFPHVILGDMDSIDPQQLAQYEQGGAAVLRFSSEKDELDTELAIDEAIKRGCTELVMIGVVGGRLDQTMANLHLLAYAAAKGAIAQILDSQHQIFLVTPQQPLIIEGNPGDLLSLIPLSEQVEQVNSHGLKWELAERVFTVGKPFGISNQFTGHLAEIYVGKGLLLAIKLLA